ncbi:uncharacterized protein LOC133743028 [Rosa rugosa]|uniref:uncharacterized protein LOC133743028 n=1 Tax=Rosa rugosa TaxID=74645 RepID=UPI002B403960|nr:uncharacterized protein LOC133743028 [Rosa rugosa]
MLKLRTSSVPNHTHLLALLADILSTWDLEAATAGSVRRHLEEDFRVDLSNPEHRSIQEYIDIFFDDGKEDVNESKGTKRNRKRKRKRKVPEICRVSPQLQELVGGGSEMTRAEAVKKIVAYSREKGLLTSKRIIVTDDKLDALLPKCKFIFILRLDYLLSQHRHMQSLRVAKDDGGVRKGKRNNEANGKRSENCEGDQVRVKKKRNNIKRNINLALAEEDVRPWDKMPEDIMVKIFKLLPFPYWSFYPCYVCRSWQLAVADVMFPPNNNELDLRLLDSYPWKSRERVLLLYLRIVLNSRPAIPWATLYLPEKTEFITNEVLTWIAQKTPELLNLSVPKKLRGDVFLESVTPKWKNLRMVHIDISANNFSHLQANCTFLSELSLYGWMDDDSASMLAKSFPNLKSLEIYGCTMSNHTLGIIMDGHKNLKLVATRKKNFYHHVDLLGHKLVEAFTRGNYYRFETCVELELERTFAGFNPIYH